MNINQQEYYEFHEIANIYPMAEFGEYELLKESIKERGLKQAIVIYQNKILDGRNRYRACLELDKKFKIEVFKGTEDEALKYSIELNSGRRNLDKSQKAMVAASTIEKYKAEGKPKLTIAQASKYYGVSPKYVQRALKILNENLTIAEQVLDGIETIGGAERRLEEIHFKSNQIANIEHDVAMENIFDDDKSDVYRYLYSLDNKALVKIIVTNGYKYR